MASLESLNDRQRAVLQLLLRQGKSYDDLAGLLGTDASGVRSRAHQAVEALGPANAGVGHDRRRELTDYLLGQQSASQRAATREYLEGSADGRAWARAAAAALSPVAGEEALPDIPEQREGSDALERTAPQEIARSPQLGGKLVAGGLGLVIAIIVIVVFGPLSGDDGANTTSASTPAAATSTATTPTAGTPTTPSGDKFQVLAQGELKPPQGSGSKAAGQVALVRFPDNNEFRLALQARKLEPSSTSEAAYGVWFYTSPRRAKFVGFPDIAVGQDGKLETVADLDPNTRTYREVLVTHERSERPERPGTIILRGRLLTATSQTQGTSTTP